MSPRPWLPEPGPIDELNIAYETALHHAYDELREEVFSHGDHSSCESADCAFKHVQTVLNIEEQHCPKCGWQLPLLPSEHSPEYLCSRCTTRWTP